MARESRALLEERAKLPGGFVIAETGEKIYLLDKKEGNLYDTLVIGDITQAYTITLGMKFEWFLGVSAKSKAFTSFKVDKKVPAGWYIAVTKLGIHFRAFYGNTQASFNDILKIAENSYANLTKVETIKKEEPPMFWQSGFGWAGTTTANASSLITAGVPSPAAIPNIKVPFSLKPDDDVEGWIAFDRNTLPDTGTHAYVYPTLDSAVACTIIMHGLILKSGVKS